MGLDNLIIEICEYCEEKQAEGYVDGHTPVCEECFEDHHGPIAEK